MRVQDDGKSMTMYFRKLLNPSQTGWSSPPTGGVPALIFKRATRTVALYQSLQPKGPLIKRHG